MNQSNKPVYYEMQEIQASEAKIHLASLLDAVEHGETILITRHGRPIARLVPEAHIGKQSRRQAIEDVKALRNSLPGMSLEEALSLRHEGHRY